MTLESSITELNASVQTLIKVISGSDAPIAKPKAVKATKPAPAKKAEPTIIVMAAEADAAAAAADAAAGNFPSLEDVIDEMRNITDRSILSGLMKSFGSIRASDIPADKRSAFIEALQLELQKGAA